MKTVQDKDGNVIEVSDNTPCHAGINGALPVMLDATLDAAIFTERAEAKVHWDTGAVKRNAVREIGRLEGEVTQRKIREAILGIDNFWLAAQEALIEIERSKL